MNHSFKQPEQINLVMTNGYGTIEAYQVKDECPHCGSAIKKTGTSNHCRDGECGVIDMFTCEQGCRITYGDMQFHNGYRHPKDLYPSMKYFEQVLNKMTVDNEI